MGYPLLSERTLSAPTKGQYTREAPVGFAWHGDVAQEEDEVVPARKVPARSEGVGRPARAGPARALNRGKAPSRNAAKETSTATGLALLGLLRFFFYYLLEGFQRLWAHDFASVDCEARGALDAGVLGLPEILVYDGLVLTAFESRFEPLRVESRLPGEVEELLIGEGAAVGGLLVLVEQVVVIPKVALLLGGPGGVHGFLP